MEELKDECPNHGRGLHLARHRAQSLMGHIQGPVSRVLGAAML